MKKEFILSIAIFLLFLAYLTIDPISYYYTNKYGISFNKEREKVNLSPVKAGYEVIWDDKRHIAFEFLPTQLDTSMRCFIRKRLLLKNGNLKSECDIFRLISSDSSESHVLYKLYDFQENRDDYHIELARLDTSGVYYVKNRTALNRQSADSILRNWKN